MTDVQERAAGRPPARAVRRPNLTTAEGRRRTGRLLFLLAAGISFGLSVTLWFTDARQEAVFVGLWVPSILSAGAFWIASAGA